MHALAENLADVFVFVKVVDTGSFSAAARVTGSTKSTISKRIRRLEEALGAKLLNRTTRHLALTEAGQAAYEHSVRIVEETTSMHSAIDGLQARPRGHVRVTTSVAFGNLHLTRLIGDFLKAYPDITVTLILNDRYVDLVDEGVDMAIRLTSKPVESFVARKLATLDYVLCASPAYLDSHAPIATIADLDGHQFLINGALPAAPWRFISDGQVTQVQPAGRFTVNSSESLRVAVLGGMGIALLPTFAIGAELRDGGVRAVLSGCTVEGAFGDSLYAVFSPSKFVAPKMRVLVDFLVAKFASGPPWDQP